MSLNCSFCKQTKEKVFSGPGCRICWDCVTKIYLSETEKNFPIQPPAPQKYWVTLSNLEVKYLILRYGIEPGTVPKTADEIKEEYNLDDTFIMGMEKNIINKLFFDNNLPTDAQEIGLMENHAKQIREKTFNEQIKDFPGKVMIFPKEKDDD